MSKHSAEEFNELGKNQEWRIKNQVNNVFVRSGMLAAGESRHEDKAAHAGDSHAMAQNTGIHSWGTWHKLQGEARTFCRFAWQNYGIRNVNQLKPQMVSDFARELGARGYSRNSINNYMSGLNRFAVVLDKGLGQGNRSETWAREIASVRGEVLRSAPRLDTGARSYDRPDELVASIRGEAYQVVASLQLACGLRLNDAMKLRELRDTGSIAHSKGGQTITPNIPDSIKSALERLQGSELHVDKAGYLNALKNACDVQNTAYYGSHGLRHNYAINQYNSYRAEGMSKAEALKAAAEDMGHHRTSITLVYLR